MVDDSIQNICLFSLIFMEPISIKSLSRVNMMTINIDLQETMSIIIGVLNNI